MHAASPVESSLFAIMASWTLSQQSQAVYGLSQLLLWAPVAVRTQQCCLPLVIYQITWKMIIAPPYFTCSDRHQWRSFSENDTHTKAFCGGRGKKLPGTELFSIILKNNLKFYCAQLRVAFLIGLQMYFITNLFKETIIDWNRPAEKLVSFCT